MPYLIPPMASEPPPDYVAFVARHLGALKVEAARLTGGDSWADEVYPAVLTDVAGHWRRLRWRGRLLDADAATAFLHRRLTRRTRQWREDQIYPVEVQVSARQVTPLPQRRAPSDSVALRLAPLLPSTTRLEIAPVAEAGIAWVHAYRRYRWRCTGRIVGGVLLSVGALVQVMSRLSGS